jgi:hypothetical protein
VADRHLRLTYFEPRLRDDVPYSSAPAPVRRPKVYEAPEHPAGANVEGTELRMSPADDGSGLASTSIDDPGEAVICGGSYDCAPSKPAPRPCTGVAAAATSSNSDWSKTCDLADRSEEAMSDQTPATVPDRPPHFGRIIDRRGFGDGPRGRVGTFVLQDEADDHSHSFEYTDIVTEGFRTIRTGEPVRFHLPRTDAWRATSVIRPDQPAPEAFYR